MNRTLKGPPLKLALQLLEWGPDNQQNNIAQLVAKRLGRLATNAGCEFLMGLLTIDTLVVSPRFCTQERILYFISKVCEEVLGTKDAKAGRSVVFALLAAYMQSLQPKFIAITESQKEQEEKDEVAWADYKKGVIGTELTVPRLTSADTPAIRHTIETYARSLLELSASGCSSGELTIAMADPEMRSLTAPQPGGTRDLQQREMKHDMLSLLLRCGYRDLAFDLCRQQETLFSQLVTGERTQLYLLTSIVGHVYDFPAAVAGVCETKLPDSYHIAAESLLVAIKVSMWPGELARKLWGAVSWDHGELSLSDTPLLIAATTRRDRTGLAASWLCEYMNQEIPSQSMLNFMLNYAARQLDVGLAHHLMQLGADPEAELKDPLSQLSGRSRTLGFTFHRFAFTDPLLNAVRGVIDARKDGGAPDAEAVRRTVQFFMNTGSPLSLRTGELAVVAAAANLPDVVSISLSMQPEPLCNQRKHVLPRRLRDTADLTPMRAAVLYDAVDCVHYLVDVVSWSQDTVSLAARCGAAHCFPVLFSRVCPSPSELQALLVDLASAGSTECCALVIRRLRGETPSGSALAAAVENGHQDTAISLIRQGVPFNTDSGTWPFITALKRGYWDVVRELLGHIMCLDVGNPFRVSYSLAAKNYRFNAPPLLMPLLNDLVDGVVSASETE